METLRFITAGNVDDGKSTLIGRLLYDSGSIHSDQLGVIAKQTKTDTIDLSLITDGLRAEREQGITIDVAYKYFSTQKRKFIIADAPGHEQYTRNMITGASNSDLIIILIDARNGITAQTKRHASIGSLVGIKKALVLINKIDLVNYSEEIFQNISSDFENLRTELKYTEVQYIPVSALVGDNIVDLSTRTNWYKGKTLLDILETITIDSNENKSTRFQVQWVIRPKTDAFHDYRGYAGPILSGFFTKNDKVKILPQNIETTIVKIEVNLKEVDIVKAGENAVLHFAEDVDISRGDSIVKLDENPTVTNQISSWVSWLDNSELQIGKPYLLQHRFKTVRVKIKSIDKKWDVNNWEFNESSQIKMNDIGQISFQTSQPIVIDKFEENDKNGNAILIDESTNNTVGALMFI